MPYSIEILSLFPEMFPGPLALSITGRALENNICTIKATSLRKYAKDKHQTVDDTSYGGGAGMIMKPDVLASAIDDKFIANSNPIILLSPRGKRFDQKMAHELSGLKGINLLCTRFEGIDERVIMYYNLLEVSMGDYILSCGDVAALSLLDAVIRLLPSVIEQKGALDEESFALEGPYMNLLEYPHYTKPATWRDIKVPDVLMSGNHEEIKKWRLEQAIKKTKAIRPDLLLEGGPI